MGGGGGRQRPAPGCSPILEAAAPAARPGGDGPVVARWGQDEVLEVGRKLEIDGMGIHFGSDKVVVRVGVKVSGAGALRYQAAGLAEAALQDMAWCRSPKAAPPPAFSGGDGPMVAMLGSRDVEGRLETDREESSFCSRRYAALVEVSGAGLRVTPAQFEVALRNTTPIPAAGRDLMTYAQAWLGRTGAFGIYKLEQISFDGSTKLLALVFISSREGAAQLWDTERGFNIHLEIPNHLVQLDEADRMLDMGFEIWIRKTSTVMNLTSKTVRSMMLYGAIFSAEMQQYAELISIAQLLHAQGASKNFICCLLRLIQWLCDPEWGFNIILEIPKHLVQFLERSNISLDAKKYLVMDEADRMLDMGLFELQRRKPFAVTNLTSKLVRRMMLLGATSSQEMQVVGLAEAALQDDFSEVTGAGRLVGIDQEEDSSFVQAEVEESGAGMRPALVLLGDLSLTPIGAEGRSVTACALTRSWEMTMFSGLLVSGLALVSAVASRAESECRRRGLQSPLSSAAILHGLRFVHSSTAQGSVGWRHNYSYQSAARASLFVIIMCLLIAPSNQSPSIDTSNTCRAPYLHASQMTFLDSSNTCPAPYLHASQIQFKRQVPGARLFEVEDLGFKYIFTSENECSEQSRLQKAVAVISFFANFAPLLPAIRIANAAPRRILLLGISSLLRAEANLLWIFYFLGEKCATGLVFGLASLTCLLSSGYSIVFWWHTALTGIYTLLILLVCIMTAFIGYAYPTAAGSFGLIFTVFSHITRIISTLLDVQEYHWFSLTLACCGSASGYLLYMQGFITMTLFKVASLVAFCAHLIDVLLQLFFCCCKSDDDEIRDILHRALLQVAEDEQDV